MVVCVWQSWGRWRSSPPPSAAPGCVCYWYGWRWRPGAPSPSRNWPRRCGRTSGPPTRPTRCSRWSPGYGGPCPTRRRWSWYPAATARLLSEALALWRGPALGEVATAPFASGYALRLEEARLTAIEDRAQADLTRFTQEGPAPTRPAHDHATPAAPATQDSTTRDRTTYGRTGQDRTAQGTPTVRTAASTDGTTRLTGPTFGATTASGGTAKGGATARGQSATEDGTQEGGEGTAEGGGAAGGGRADGELGGLLALELIAEQPTDHRAGAWANAVGSKRSSASTRCWHLWSRWLRKILSHTMAILLCQRAGLSPLQFARLLTS